MDSCAHGLLSTVDIIVHFNLFGYSSSSGGWGAVEVGISRLSSLHFDPLSHESNEADV